MRVVNIHDAAQLTMVEGAAGLYLPVTVTLEIEVVDIGFPLEVDALGVKMLTGDLCGESSGAKLLQLQQLSDIEFVGMKGARIVGGLLAEVDLHVGFQFAQSGAQH